MRINTVKELIEVLKDLDGDMPVVCPQEEDYFGFDVSLNPAYVKVENDKVVIS